ncbi:hypothetical protein IPH70_01100 [Candidatus Roizmanbacteria bacterium]|nr:MAG: hypothetical protein IPH70_01100 [Candidatus Roizmanbacteria bacterium]
MTRSHRPDGPKNYTTTYPTPFLPKIILTLGTVFLRSPEVVASEMFAFLEE